MTTTRPSPTANPDASHAARRSRAVLALVLTAVLWSTSGVLIKVIDWQPMSILAGRSALGTVVFLIYLRGPWLGARRTGNAPRRRRSAKWPRITWAHGIGAAAFLATQILYISATKLTTAANAIFLQFTAPVYVILLGIWWLKERPDRVDWIVLPVVAVGMACFFGEQLSFAGLAGNVLALISGATMAVMTVTLRHISLRGKGRDPDDVQDEGAQGYTILLSFIAALLVGLPSIVHEAFTWRNVAIIAYLGAFQIGLAFVLYSSAIPHVRALETTLITGLEPILNPIWVFLVVGENPGPLALLGGALVIGAVVARALLSARPAARSQQQTIPIAPHPKARSRPS